MVSRTWSGLAPVLRAAATWALSWGRVCMAASAVTVSSSRSTSVSTPVEKTSPKISFWRIS